MNRIIALGVFGILVACSSGNGGATKQPVVTNEAIDARVAPVVTIDANAPKPGGIEAAKQRALDSLAAEVPDAALEVNVVDGYDGLRIVRARHPEAYPGTGVAALIYDPATDRTHGKRGEHSLAVLLQSRGWIENRPPDDQLIRLVHEATFDGILILQGPIVEVAADGTLQVSLPAYTMRGDHDRTWIVSLPATGDETVTKAP